MILSLVDKALTEAEDHAFIEHGHKTASYCPDCGAEHIENRNGETCEKCGSTIAGYAEWGVQSPHDQAEAEYLKDAIKTLNEAARLLQKELLQRMP